MACAWHHEEVLCEITLKPEDSHCVFSAQPAELDEDLDIEIYYSDWAQFYRGWQGWIGWAGESSVVAYRTYSDDINVAFWSQFEDLNEGISPDEADGDEAVRWVLTAILRSIFCHGVHDSHHGSTPQ